jgi:eukaryotic translation initiation factor 2C
MNFNVSTSAFFRPVLVSDFLEDTSTFFDRAERIALLTKLHVYVERTHMGSYLNRPGARIKKISAIRDARGTNFENLSFFKKLKDPQTNKPIPDPNVGSHCEPKMLTELALTLARVQTGRVGVNVGSDAEPVRYAQELLCIVSYQLYTRPVPDHLTVFTVKKAAHSPAHSQWLIHNEGLRHLGFTEVKDQLVGLVSSVGFRIAFYNG